MIIETIFAHPNRVLYITINQKVFEHMPLKVAMKLLEILSVNHQADFHSVEFDKKTEQFIVDHHPLYQQQLLQENSSFKQWSSALFDALHSPLYSDPDRLYKILSSIYDKESSFLMIQPPIIQPIQYTFDHDSLHKHLKIHNIDALIQLYGPAETLHAMTLFVGYLNEEHLKQNLRSSTSYQLSKELIRATFDESQQKHPQIPSFDGFDSILDQLFNQSMLKISRPELILSHVLLDVALKKQLQNPAPSNTLKRKKNNLSSI